jgi:hypothetical protein
MSRMKVVAFWNEVHNLFPTEEIYNWMCAVAEGRADWWRNGGLALIAVAEHSKSARGLFSPVLYDENRAKLQALIEKFNVDLQA